MKFVPLLALAALGIVPLVWAGDNIAPLAEVSGSSEFSARYAVSRVNDRIIGVRDQGEWACEGRTEFWGGIRYPWVQLTWSEPQTIDRLVLYDRASLDEHTAGGTLEFSDGSKVRAFTIPNRGGPKAVTFEPKTISWVRFQITDGLGKNLGLSEIEVFPHLPPDDDLVAWVDPTIETTRGRWFFCAPGSRPFGLVSAAPYTRNKNQWGGGYNYNSTEILGFSQIHDWIMSGVNLMPTAGDLDPCQGEQGWKSPFSHDSEIIQPGYQRVYLDRYGLWVEMTCTDRVVLYRITATEDVESRVLLSLGGWLGSVSMVGAAVEPMSDTRLAGSVGTTGRLWGGPELTRVFFVADFERPFSRLDGWQGQQRLTGIDRLAMPVSAERIARNRDYLFKNPAEEQAGVSVFHSLQAGESLQVKLALSFTSVENALNNLRQECPHWKFDEVRADAKSEWNEWLGKIRVRGGTRAQTVKFYTDLWHTLLGRHKLDDYSGDYPIYMDAEPNPRSTAELRIEHLPRNDQGASAFHMYNSDALWLTMWNLNVLYGLAWPEVLDNFAASLVRYADHGGALPRGPSAGGYTFIMTGSPATSLIAAAYQKGLLRKVDVQHAYRTMKRNHLPGGGMGVDAFYDEHGWKPNSPGLVVQWAFEDWALAQMARELGKIEDYHHFMGRASGWKEMFHPEIGLLLPKGLDGRWTTPDPLSGQGWVEANAWQGTFAVSHDISGLAALMGGVDQLAAKLNSAFEQAVSTDFVFGYGSGTVSYANQPGCSNAHVFNHAGHPWLAQYWVRQVNEAAYGAVTPDAGYGGHDEDQGQMGGVSALMSLGLFSLRGTCAPDPIYEITAPVFDEVLIELDSRYYLGESFRIRTYNNSATNLYIQRAALNGTPLDNCWFTHEDFARGGLLELWLGPEPNRAWGESPLAR